MRSRADFAKVMGLVFDGKLHPVMDKTFPLKEARAAQARLEKGKQLGKIVLEIA